jgi:hypothetical protein
MNARRSRPARFAAFAARAPSAASITVAAVIAIIAAALPGCASTFSAADEDPVVAPIAGELPDHLDGSPDERINRVRSTSGFDNALVRPLGRTRWVSPRDVQPLIQAAIDDIPPAGGTIQLPAGTLNIEAPIRIDRSDVRLRGEGRGRTTIRFRDMAMQGEILDCIEVVGPDIDEPIRNIMISDLSVDANYWNQPGSYNPRGIDSDNAARLLVENVRISNAFVGLTFGLGVTEATAFNVEISNWHNDAFNASGDVVDGGARDILFHYCTARDSFNERRGGSPGNRNNAWEIEDGAQDVTLLRCRVIDASGNGFGVRNHGFDDAATTGPVTFIECTAQNVGGNGFFVIGNRWPNAVAHVRLDRCETDSVSTFTKGVRGLEIVDSDFGATVSIGPAKDAVVRRSTMPALTIWSFGVDVAGEPSASYETSVVLEDVSIGEQLSIFGNADRVDLVRTEPPANSNVTQR